MINIAFCSGMSSASDLRGAMAAKAAVGVVAGLLTTVQVILSLPRYLNEGGKVFIDSGAFAEFTGKAPLDIRAVLSVYRTVAELTDRPENLYVVAPDKIGDQTVTLERLSEHRRVVVDLINMGCNVIVPIQCGPMPPASFLKEVKLAIGTDRFIAGIPSNKAAMKPEEVATLEHPQFHILGRVAFDGDQKARIAAILETNPDASITADASWLRSRLRKVNELREAIHTERLAGAVSSFETPRARAVEELLRDEAEWQHAEVDDYGMPVHRPS